MIGATSSMYSAMQRPSPQEMFAKMDTDGSEGLSADEIEGTKLSEAVGDNFSGVDTDGNGELSHDELEALRETLEGETSSNGGQSGDRPPPPPPPPSEGGGGLQMSLLTALMDLDAEDSEDTSSGDVLSSVTGSSETEDASTAEFTSSEDIASSLLDDALAAVEEDTEEEDVTSSLIDEILLDEEAA